jgi:hypothetical protein
MQSQRQRKAAPLEFTNDKKLGVFFGFRAKYWICGIIKTVQCIGTVGKGLRRVFFV